MTSLIILKRANTAPLGKNTLPLAEFILRGVAVSKGSGTPVGTTSRTSTGIVMHSTGEGQRVLGAWFWLRIGPDPSWDPQPPSRPYRLLLGAILTEMYLSIVLDLMEETMDLSPEEQSRTVVSSRIINAPISEVFDAYANPQKIVRWWGPSGFTLRTESIDLNEGGHWRFVFKGPDGTEYKNHVVFLRIEQPQLFVVDHLSGPKYRGTVIFDGIGDKTGITMYWTFENAEVFAKIRESVIAGNEGNLDRLSEVVAGRR
jgi:hypothetical protein